VRESASRTLLAALLTLVAIALPAALWHAAESEQVRVKASMLRAEPRHAAEQAARRLATSLHAELERLRANEARRPYYHYQHLYHDPEGVYEGLSLQPSPLLLPPAHAFVRAYFQIDPAGAVTLPQLTDDDPTTADDTGRDDLIALRDALRRAAAELARGAGAPSGRPGTRQQVLDPAAYAQNADPQQVTRAIRLGKAAGRAPELPVKASYGKGGPERGKVVVDSSDPAWRTVTLGGAPALVALRRVETPDGVLAQGFVVDDDELQRWLAAAHPHAHLRASRVKVGERAAFPIADQSWSVIMDLAAVAAPGDAAADALRGAFRHRFVLGVAFAGLVGAGVVALAWGSERLARERSRFAALAAHELRTPLSGLRLHAEMLAEGLGDPTRQADYAQRLAGEAARLGRVVTNVLGFTRMERGSLVTHPAKGDVARAVADVVQRLEPVLAGACARVVLERPEGAVDARFDAEALAHVLENLLDNAEKYSRGASDRTITVRVARHARGGAEVSVTDRGPGVPAPLARRLFRPFARGSHSVAPAGLGVGLALSRALARAMGGDLTLAPTDGPGATFVLRMEKGV
jgi:signal transduction histidine kinase